MSYRHPPRNPKRAPQTMMMVLGVAIVIVFAFILIRWRDVSKSPTQGSNPYTPGPTVDLSFLSPTPAQTSGAMATATPAIAGEPKADEPIQLSFTKADVHSGFLMLINQDHMLPEDYLAPLTANCFARSDRGFSLANSDIELQTDVLDAMSRMSKAAAEDGVTGFLITSGYRTTERQTEIYLEEGPNGKAAPPRASEHETGMALDVWSMSYPEDFATSDEWRWIEQHCHEYGFIIRYPQDKQDITGIMFEPWHLRYVGSPHAQIIHDQGWTLEEYIEALHHSPFEATVMDTSYQILYTPVDQPVTLPQTAIWYSLSGDNENGVIVTVRVM